VADGICIRLYSEADYLTRPIFTTPEILRSNFAGVLLQLMYLKLGHVSDFPFIDMPSKKHISDAIDTLKELGALSSEAGLELTPLGKLMARLPLDPRVSRMVIEGIRRGCPEEIITIASVLGIGDPREVSKDGRTERFSDPSSDFISLLKIWKEMEAHLGGARSHTKLKRYCREKRLSFRRMREWMEVREQIKTILAEDPRLMNLPQAPREDLYPALHKSILSGYLTHIGEKGEKNSYRGTRGREFMIFPGSGLFKGGGKWVVSAELVATSRLYARINANIEPEWVEEVGKGLCRYTYAEPFWDREREDVIAREKVSFLGLILCHGRNVSFSRLHPEEAHPIFIREGLMKGEIKSRFRFLRHNQDLVERLRAIEHKTRRRGLVDEEAIFSFYSERLPGMANVAQLKRLIQKKGGDGFLMLKEEDCLAQEVPEDTSSAYPDYVSVSDHMLPLTYRFHPGEPEDGATLFVPAPLIVKISASLVDRLIPGLLKEKVELLIKGLPKEYRRRLPLASEWVEQAYEKVKNDTLPLPQSLSRFVKENFGFSIPAQAWPISRLPDYLKVRLTVLDEKNSPLATGRNIEELRELVIESKESEAARELSRLWEREGLSSWDFDDLPAKVSHEGPAGITLVKYPALTVSKHGVDIRLFSSFEEAEANHRRGVARLYELSLPHDVKQLKKTLKVGGKWKEWGEVCWKAGTLEAVLYEKVVRDVLGKPVRSREEFLRQRDELRRLLIPRAYEVMEMALPVVEAAAEVKRALERIREKEGKSPAIEQFCADLERECSRLAPPDFLLTYPEERLPHLVRYLKALAIRAHRGVLNLEKDKKRREEIRFYEEKLAQLKKLTDVDRTFLEEFRWMLEEYRVSLFAQEIKTAFPVSSKRLKEKLAEIEF